MNSLNCFVRDSIELEPLSHGPLDSMTFVAKDCISVVNHTSSFGRPAWRETRSPSDTTAAVVTKLLEAGARMKGLVKLERLTYSLTGN